MGSNSQGHRRAWVHGVIDAAISFDPPGREIKFYPPEVQLRQALGVPSQPRFRTNTAADAPVAGAAGGGGLRALDAEEVAIVAVPGRTDAANYDALLNRLRHPRNRVAILDGPMGTDDIGALSRVATAVCARAAGASG